MLAPCPVQDASGTVARGAWAVSADESAQASALAEHVREHGARVVWLVGPGGSFARSFASAGAQRGVRVVRRPTLDAATITAAARPPDAIVADSDPAVARRLLQALRRDGVTIAVFGASALDRAELIDSPWQAVEGTTFVTFGYPVPGSELDEFYERYKARFGRRPHGSGAARGYAAVRVIDSAVNVAGSRDPAQLAAALPGLQIGSPLGVIRYRDSGERVPEGELALVTVRGGRFELVRTVAP